MLEQLRLARQRRDDLAAELEAAESGDSDSESMQDLKGKSADAAKEATRLEQHADQLRYYAKPTPPMALALADRPVPTDASIHLGGNPHNRGGAGSARPPFSGAASGTAQDREPPIDRIRLPKEQRTLGTGPMANRSGQPPASARDGPTVSGITCFGAGIVRSSVDNFGPAR